jgi:hypothetical protein
VILQKIPKNPQSQTTSEQDYYYMKFKDRKGQKDRPSVRIYTSSCDDNKFFHFFLPISQRIEFQMVNSGMNKKMRKSKCKCCHHHYQHRNRNNVSMQFEPTTHCLGNAEDDANIYDENNQKRKTFGDVFATMCCHNMDNSSCNGDLLEAQKPSEDYTEFIYQHPHSVTEKAAEFVFKRATIFWAEVFGLINILIAIPLALILQVFW